MSSRQILRDHALLLSRVAIGDADLVLHFFTQGHGKISALARGARRSQKSFAGALEPLHTLTIEFEEKAGSELHLLKEAVLLRPRIRLTDSLEGMELAGRALTWVRKASPARTPEPAVFEALEELLDRLNHELALDAIGREGFLLQLGLRILDRLGFGLELLRCVSCGKACPTSQSAWLTPERGGIVCRACGGGPILVSSSLREWMQGSLDDVAPPRLEVGRDVALTIIERAIDAHISS